MGELRDGEILGEEFAPEATVDVNLVRRSPHAARILQDVLAAPSHDVTRCLRQAGDEALTAHEIVLAAVSKNGDALQWASADLKADREIVLAAVSNDGFALQYASADLKADREIVVIAVSKNGNSLQYASADLKADREFLGHLKI